MERVTLTNDLTVSRLVYGLWRLGDDEDTSPAHVQRKVESCLEQGITTMDHADIYGGYTGEAIFGAAIKAAPSLRERIEIVSKCGIVAPMGRHSGARVKHYDTGREHITTSVETSLRDMNIERLDLLLIHRPDPMIDPQETGAVLDELVQSGKVRAVGVSNFRPFDLSLLQSAMTNRLVTNQIELSLLETQAFTNGDLASLMERSIAPMAWSPLGGGRLFSQAATPLKRKLNEVASSQGVDAGAVAIAWLLVHPARILPVLGTNSLSRIAAISEATRVSMDRQTWFELFEAARGHEVA